MDLREAFTNLLLFVRLLKSTAFFAIDNLPRLLRVCPIHE